MANEIDDKIDKVQQSQERSEARLRQELEKTESRIITQISKQLETVSQLIRTERMADKEAFNSTLKRLEECNVHCKGKCEKTVKGFEESIEIIEDKMAKHTLNHVRSDDVKSVKNEQDVFKKDEFNKLVERVSNLEIWKSNNWRQIIIYSVAAGIILYKGINIVWGFYEKMPKGIKGV